jgi:hypothetical protein
MAGELLIACPTCAQKYRVSPERAGHRAHCKKCGQKFRIKSEDPIDDQTILGWVMEGDEPDQSVMGSTSIFTAHTSSVRRGRPDVEEWQTPAPPARPRVRFDRIDESGVCFEFPAAELKNPDLRKSFPHKCFHCLGSENLEVHLIIWGDKLPRQGEFHVNDLKSKALGRLDQMLRTDQKRWLDQLEPMSILPPPFSNPFPYFVCRSCNTVGEITARVTSRQGEDRCHIVIANPEIAREFFHNNGGKSAPGYRRVADAAARQRDDRWQRLAFPVRNRIATWFKPDSDERFLAYFRDADFSRSETGTAGVVLTDRRIIYRKYATMREFDIGTGGKLSIKADARQAEVHISQVGTREATLKSNPVSASHLAKALAKLEHPWKISVQTRNGGTGQA